MLFSVLVPVYNVEKYLTECINSILNQTEQDYELILIDDGSTDSSGMICDSFAERYPDIITVKHNKNQGLILTRMDLMKSAHGEYLVHVDSDDYLRIDALSLVKKAIEQYQPDMVIYGLHRIGLDGTGTDQLMTNTSIIYEGSDKVALYKTMCSTSQLNNYVTKVVRRELALSSECFLNYPQVKIGEDLLQSLPIMTNAQKIFFLAEPLYNYKQDREEYIRLFHEISKDNLFLSSKDSIKDFPAWKKMLWKLIVLDNPHIFSYARSVIRDISGFKRLLVR